MLRCHEIADIIPCTAGKGKLAIETDYTNSLIHIIPLVFRLCSDVMLRLSLGNN